MPTISSLVILHFILFLISFHEKLLIYFKLAIYFYTVCNCVIVKNKKISPHGDKDIAYSLLKFYPLALHLNS